MATGNGAAREPDDSVDLSVTIEIPGGKTQIAHWTFTAQPE